jgi:hypothetical protein
MSAAKVTIVVVNFRTPAVTLDCIRSLRTLDYPNWNLLVVDNASGDDSPAQLRAELAEREFLLAESNGGYTAGNNLGIRAALDGGAEYVLILNPDTVVHRRDFVTKLAEFLDAHPRVAAVGPRVYLREPGRVQNTVLEFPWLWRRAANAVAHRLFGRPLRSGEEVRQAEVLNGVCVLFRSAALREVGLFDERTFAYIEDVDWAYRAKRLGWRQAYLPVDGVVHLQKEAGYERGGAVDFLLKRNTLYFLMKTGHWLQAVGYTAATLTLAGVHRLTARSSVWSGRLVRAYWALWTNRWHACMGHPSRGGVA